MFDSEYMKRQVEIVQFGSPEQRLILARQFGHLIRAHMHILLALTTDADAQVQNETRSWLEQIEAMAGDAYLDGGDSK